MRHARASFRIAAFLTAVTVLACAGGDKDAVTADTAASAAAAAPPPPESFTMVANDGSWTADITPSGIVYRPKSGDSLTFPFKAPTVSGAISEYDALKTDTDTIRLTVNLAMTPCTAGGTQHTHLAQIWLSGKQKGRTLNTDSKGCASRK